MKFNMYSVHDGKECLYCPPFLARSHASAWSMFSQAKKETKKEKDDSFTLWFLGTFDNETCDFVPEQNPSVLSFDEPKEE